MNNYAQSNPTKSPAQSLSRLVPKVVVETFRIILWLEQFLNEELSYFTLLAP